MFSVSVICAGGGAGGLCVDKYGQGIKAKMYFKLFNLVHLFW